MRRSWQFRTQLTTVLLASLQRKGTQFMRIAVKGTRSLPNRRQETAADLMIPVSVAISERSTIPDALSVLNRNRLNAAPVLDSIGQPVGVITQADLQAKIGPKTRRRDQSSRAPTASQVVGDIMMPVFFSVRPEMPAERVVQEIRALRLHRLFVIADGKGLVGFINGTSLLEEDAGDNSSAAREERPGSTAATHSRDGNSSRSTLPPTGRF
jgi:CBS-domain-containing membrane protein